MQIIPINPAAPARSIRIGKQGENMATGIAFDVRAFLRLWPAAAVALAVKPKAGSAYPVALTLTDGVALWAVTAADTAQAGSGECELRVIEGEVIKKSVTFETYVAPSFTATGTAPDPVEDWLNDAAEALGEVQTATQTANTAAENANAKAALANTAAGAANTAAGKIDNMTVAASGLAAGESPTAVISEVSGHKHIAFGIPKGDKGDKGDTGEKGDTGAIGLQGPKGDTGATGAQGPQGQTGATGAAGADGVTFTPAVDDGGNLSWTNDGGRQNPATVNIKGPQGETGATGQTGATGADGQDGYSPTVTVTEITGGHEVTITDAEGDHTFDVMDGTSGSGGVSDVQINGVSILVNGVANVPKAGSSNLGVIKASNSFGTNVNSNGTIQTYPSAAADCRIGTDAYKPIVPSVQQAAAFYGLAKAAGDSTQAASNNAVGAYTETAKSKISDMLSAPVTVSGSTPSITAMAGVRYVCGECATLSVIAPASGIIDVVFQSGSTATVLTVTSAKSGVTAIKWAGGFDSTNLEADTIYEINILDGEYGVVGSWT